MRAQTAVNGADHFTNLDRMCGCERLPAARGGIALHAYQVPRPTEAALSSHAAMPWQPSLLPPAGGPIGGVEDKRRPGGKAGRSRLALAFGESSCVARQKGQGRGQLPVLSCTAGARATTIPLPLTPRPPLPRRELGERGSLRRPSSLHNQPHLTRSSHHPSPRKWERGRGEGMPITASSTIQGEAKPG